MRRLVPPGSADQLKKMIPLGRFGAPDDIGQLSVFLASPLASYITGTRVVADGGQNLPGSGAWTQLIMTEMTKAAGQ
ncbi:MAG: SDR family oxidoreductase, partial [Candidatus Competibacteraceae bacterium]